MWELSFYETRVHNFHLRYRFSIRWLTLCSRRKENATHYFKSKEHRFWQCQQQLPRHIWDQPRRLKNFAIDFQKHFCKSIKLLRPPTTSNSNMGPSGLCTGPNFWHNLLSRVIKRASFSNRSIELWVASYGNRLAIMFNMREEFRPNPFWKCLF